MKVAVVGLGAVGVQVLWQLSRIPEVEAHGFETAYPGHPDAGAGGESRLFRHFELDDPAYEPLTARADELWFDLEDESGRSLRELSGVLVLGQEDWEQIQRVLDRAERSQKPSEVLRGDELRARFPQFATAEGEVGIWDLQGGVIRPELSVSAAAKAARDRGAVVHEESRILSVVSEQSGIRLNTADSRHSFDRVVVACGGWTPSLLPHLKTRIVPRRLTSAWFHGKDDNYLQGMPAFLRAAPEYCYGIPTPGAFSVKLGLGFNDHLPAPKPDTVSRRLGTEEHKRFRWIIDNLLPGLESRPVRMNTYIESYTPSMHDYVAFDEVHPDVLVMAGFSGHGFKLCTAMGEIGAQLVTRGKSDLDLRFLNAAPDVFTITDPEKALTTHNPLAANQN